MIRSRAVDVELAGLARIEHLDGQRVDAVAQKWARVHNLPSELHRELQAGMLHVNSQTAGADVHVPFGGIKTSGYGPHEQGRASLEFFTETVTVYQDEPLT